MKIIEYEVEKTGKKFYIAINNMVMKSTWLDNLTLGLDFSEVNFLGTDKIEINRAPRFFSPYRAFARIVIKLEDAESHKIICEIIPAKTVLLSVFLLFSFPFIAAALIVFIIFNKTETLLYLTIPCLFIGLFTYLRYLFDCYMLERYSDSIINLAGSKKPGLNKMQKKVEVKSKVTGSDI